MLLDITHALHCGIPLLQEPSLGTWSQALSSWWVMAGKGHCCLRARPARLPACPLACLPSILTLRLSIQLLNPCLSLFPAMLAAGLG